MKHSSDLFILIRSMSMSEKRHFRVFSSRHTIGEKNNYIKLFEAIETLKEYDEQKVIAALAGEKFVPQLSKYKNYLYELLLKSLRIYHAGKTAGLQLKELLEYCEILYSKGLYRQCGKILMKAKKIAIAFEKLELLTEIFRREELLLQQEVDDKKAQKKIAGFAAEKQEIFSRPSDTK
jgi:hypothetical protein